MGGIVSRYYIQRLGGIQRVQRFITIASPHQGTFTAYLRPNLGCNQMRRGSLFLQNLNHDAAMLERINFTSIWSPLDLMIVPASSSHLDVGREVIVPVVLHPLMVTDNRVLQEIEKALAEPLRK
jgi:triacylglycerol lipase